MNNGSAAVDDPQNLGWLDRIVVQIESLGACLAALAVLLIMVLGLAQVVA